MAKRIGFVDFDLNNFHADIYLQHVRNELQERGFEVAACHAIKEPQGREWAQKNDVPYFADAARMNQHVDCFAVLAPSDPQTHLELCEKIFPFGKPTYVDKTFAPDLATAERIFALADQHHAPVQTTSALRYTQVQIEVELVGRDSLEHMVAWGGGRSFAEYAIHPVEMIVSCMGPQATRLLRRGTGDRVQLLIDFSRGRTAVANIYANTQTPFAASITTDVKTQWIQPDLSRLFVDMAAAMLDFFQTAQPSIDRQESLMIRRILDAAERPDALEGFVKV
jgi:hypothetical protein